MSYLQPQAFLLDWMTLPPYAYKFHTDMERSSQPGWGGCDAHVKADIELGLVSLIGEEPASKPLMCLPFQWSLKLAVPGTLPWRRPPWRSRESLSSGWRASQALCPSRDHVCRAADGGAECSAWADRAFSFGVCVLQQPALGSRGSYRPLSACFLICFSEGVVKSK